jgi:hypothetical protein
MQQSQNLNQYVPLKRICIIDGFGLNAKATSLRQSQQIDQNIVVTLIRSFFLDVDPLLVIQDQLYD